MNKNIKEAKIKFKILLIAILISQIFFLFIINIFFNKFSLNTEPNDIDFQLVKQVSTIIGIILFISIDILFYIKFIYRLHSMLYTEPQKCIIEDFIIYPYGYAGDGKKRDYRISPVVRDIKNNELYFTYGDYCLSYYSSISTHMNKKVLSKIIFRKDGSEVKIGDTAFFYIRKKVNVDVVLDKSNNIFQLNNKKFSFSHTNENYDITIFNKIIFFEGIVEVEDIMNY